MVINGMKRVKRVEHNKTLLMFEDDFAIQA